jgi:6-pyruvoyl-tetrahydropterin synthase
MYTVTARDKFTSFLSLAPPEESDGFDIYHNYLIEVAVSGETLSEQGYLIDIEDLRDELGELVATWDGALLNEFVEFESINPTLETVARVACDILAESLQGKELNNIVVTVWENELDPAPGPSASYRMSLA